MSLIRPDFVSSTVAGRRRQYLRRVSLVNWVGASFGGAITVFAALRFGEHANVPAAILPIVPIAAVFGGFCLAMARVNFEWLIERLDRRLEEGSIVGEEPLPDDLKPYPTEAEAFYIAELLLAGCAGIGVVMLAIWSAV